MGPTGNWVILFNDNNSYASGISNSLLNQLKQVTAGTVLTGITLGPNDSWALTARKNGYWIVNVPTSMGTALASIGDFGYAITSVALGQTNSFAVVYEKNGWYASATRAAGRVSSGKPRR
jgi:hypothetical protein